jgi:glycosyltransferase involved in cell wall biosynthesis
VAFLTNAFAPYKEPLLAELATRTRLTVYYCCLREPNRRWQVTYTGAYRYEVLRGVTLSVRGAFMHMNPGLVRALLRDRPRVLIVGGYSYPTVIVAPLIARVLGIRTVLWSGSTLQDRPRRHRWMEAWKRLHLRLFDQYVAYTRSAALYLHSLSIPPERVTIAPITVDVGHFAKVAAAADASGERETVRRQLGVEPGAVLLVFVGQLIDRKGGDCLLRALANVADPAVRVAMVGDGPRADDWAALAQSLGIEQRVNWLGEVGQERLGIIYAAADIFVLPSLRDASGNVTNEAMAAGLPAIISDRVGTDVVRSGFDGFVVPGGDVEALSEAIRTLAQDGPRRLAMGRSAQRRVLSDYTIARQADQFVSAVLSAAEAPESRSGQGL